MRRMLARRAVRALAAKDRGFGADACRQGALGISPNDMGSAFPLALCED
jgi:hypothetical protein